MFLFDLGNDRLWSWYPPCKSSLSIQWKRWRWGERGFLVTNVFKGGTTGKFFLGPSNPDLGNADCVILWRQCSCVQALHCATLCICLQLPRILLLWLHFVYSQLVYLLPVGTLKCYVYSFIYSFIHFGHGRLQWDGGQLSIHNVHTLNIYYITMLSQNIRL